MTTRIPSLVLPFVLVAGGLFGCVRTSTYESVQKQLAETQAQLRTRDQKIEILELTLKDSKAKLASTGEQGAELVVQIDETQQALARMQAEVTRLEGEKTRLGGEKTKLEGELATVVKDRTRLKASAQKLQQALTELGERKAEAEQRVAQYRQLLARFKSLIDAGKLKIKITEGRMVLALPTDVLFASGKARLSDEGKTAVTEVAKILATIPNRNFQIEGHTDNVPIKTARYPSNWELAAARSLVVLKAMRSVGLRGDVLSASSYGEFRPVAGNDTDDGRRANRRIEIVLVPDLSSLPGFAELNELVADG